MKGEFLCVAHQEEKIHPMANNLGTVRDMEEFKQRIQKQKRQFNKAKKEFLKYYPTEDAEVLEIEREPVVEIAPILEEKPKRERKQTPQEQLPPNIPKLALVYGDHGLGKTHAIM